MKFARFSAAALTAAFATSIFPILALGDGAAPAGTIIGAQSSDDVIVRPRLEDEISRLKKSQRATTAAQQRVDRVTAAVSAAQDQLQAGQATQALATLATLEAQGEMTPVEKYLVERVRAAAASRAGDEPLLVKTLESVVASGQLPAKERADFADVLVRKYFNRKDYPKAIAWSGTYFAEGGKDAAIRRAQLFSWYLNNNFAIAGREVALDIAADEAAGRKPSEENLRLLVSCAKKLDDKLAVASAIDKYAAYYPKDTQPRK